MSEFQAFTTEIKGFNRDEVADYIKRQQEDYDNKVAALDEQNRLQAQMIDELKRRVEQKEEQKLRLEDEIETKYKKYIDNYNKIASLVYDAEVKAEQILADAHEKEKKILMDADIEAKRRVDSVTEDVEAKIADGKKRYKDIQAQINALNETMNEAQKRFVAGYKSVHEIVSGMPESIGYEDHPYTGAASYESAAVAGNAQNADDEDTLD